MSKSKNYWVNTYWPLAVAAGPKFTGTGLTVFLPPTFPLQFRLKRIGMSCVVVDATGKVFSLSNFIAQIPASDAGYAGQAFPQNVLLDPANATSLVTSGGSRFCFANQGQFKTDLLLSLDSARSIIIPIMGLDALPPSVVAGDTITFYLSLMINLLEQ